MADIFISYNKRDRALVERVRKALSAEGFSIWWDEDVTPRETWDRALEREIDIAGYVLVLWTRNSVDSDWVRTEANYARRKGKLVQVRFDPVEIPIAFSMIQYVDLDRNAPQSGTAWSRVLGWLGRTETSAPVAAEPAPLRTKAPLWFVIAVHLISAVYLVAMIAAFRETQDPGGPSFYRTSNLVVGLVFLLGLISNLGLGLSQSWSFWTSALVLLAAFIVVLDFGAPLKTVLAAQILFGLPIGLAYFGRKRDWLH
jgi:hypothetical protein